MKKINIVILIFYLFSFCPAVESYSLKKTVDTFLEKSNYQKIRQEQKQQQRLLLQNSKANFLPTISSNFTLPGYYHSSNTPLDTLWNNYTYLSSNITLTQNFPFNADLQFTKSFNYDFENSNKYYNSSSSLQLDYHLFKKNELKLEYKKNRLYFNQLNLEQQNQLNTDIYELCQKYYDATLQKINVNILQKRLDRNSKIQRMSEIKYNAGIIDILTYNQIRLQAKQTELELKEAEKNLDYYLQMVADYIDIPKLDSISADTTIFFWSQQEFSLKSNPEINSMLINTNIYDINQKLVKDEFDWYLTLGGEYNWGGDGTDFDEFKNDLTTSDYSAYLGVTFPIYDGRISRRKELRYKSQRREQIFSIEERKKTLDTRWNYLNKMIELLKDKINVYRQTLKLSKNNLELATGKMLRGEISYYEWNQIEQEYEQNKLNLLNKTIELNEYILEANKILGNNLVEIVNNN